MFPLFLVSNIIKMRLQNTAISLLVNTFAFCALLFLVSCEGETTEPPVPSFARTLFLTQEGAQYTYRQYNADLSIGANQNLNQELGFTTPLRLTFSDNNLTAITRSGSNYDVRTLSTANGQFTLAEQVCSENSNASIDVLETYQQYTLFSGLIFDINGEPELHFVSVYNSFSDTCTRIPYPVQGNQIDRSPKIVIRGDRAFILMDDNENGGYLLYSLNLSTGTFSAPKSIPSGSNFRIIARRNLLYMFYNDGTLEELNIDDVSVTATRTHGINLGFFSSQFLSSTQIQGDRILLEISYPQPGPVSRGPVIINISTGEIEGNTPYFVFDLIEALEDEYDTANVFSVFGASLNSELVATGARVSQGSEQFNIAVFTNFKGELIGVERIGNESLVAAYLGE